MTDYLQGPMIQSNAVVQTTSAGIFGNLSVTANSLPTIGLFSPATNQLGFATNSAQVAVIDASGNLGLGVTPSAWSGFTALQIAGGGSIHSTNSNNMRMGANFYYNGTNYIRTTASYANMYSQNDAVGTHAWYNAGTSTAGSTIAWTQAMTLDASGRLLVGRTSSAGSAYSLELDNAASDNRIGMYAGGSLTSIIQTSTNQLNLSALGASGFLTLATNSAERMRIDSSGQVGIGTSVPATQLNMTGKLRFTPNNSDINYSADIYANYNSTHPFQIDVKNNGGTAEYIGVYADSGGANNRVVFPTGSVGVGSTSPTQKMTVNGSIQATSNSSSFDQNGVQLDYYSGGGRIASYISTGSILQFFTNPNAGVTAERMRIDASGYMQGTVNGLGAGRIPAMQYYRLESAVVGTNVNTAQSVLGVGVTLVGSTIYAFEAVYAGSKTAGTTSHSIGFGFGGTATLNNIAYIAFGDNLAGAFPAYAVGTIPHAYVNTAANTTFIAATATAAVDYFVRISGTVSVNAGGTFIPQYTLSAAPGGAYTTAIGSYFLIYPLSASGANTNIGTWA